MTRFSSVFTSCTRFFSCAFCIELSLIWPHQGHIKTPGKPLETSIDYQIQLLFGHKPARPQVPTINQSYAAFLTESCFSVLLHCNPIQGQNRARTGFFLCSNSHREKHVFITGNLSSHYRDFPVRITTQGYPCSHYRE